MHRTTFTDVDDFTAARLADLWNAVAPSMIEGLAEDLHYAPEEATFNAGERTALTSLESLLRRLDSGELHANPVVFRDAVQGWLAYFFRSAETPVGMPLGPVYRLAAELDDLAQAFQRERLVNTDPWQSSTSA
ncbi:hypothetical protein [Streptomyces sp. NBC_00878]|uniref:hypothetical protein n=1 Tax=Streptomyces sp. NBC_00878 TaxID=2975854 RepID=UPI002259F890|nr:hypothetical protein [Streptomyces sp. NBC_00878]MCX4906865.1 hypothetical protein [Streptomyces sp. NBC_00878]